MTQYFDSLRFLGKKSFRLNSALKWFVALIVLSLVIKVESGSERWFAKRNGGITNLEELTEWMLQGALPQNDYLIPKSGEKSLRKEYRTLSKDERHKFHACLLKLKKTPAIARSSLSEYDTFVIHHTFDYAPEAHDSPVFLPFHRVFLYILERLMRSHEGCHDTAIHYWDTSLDSMLPNPSETLIFNHPDYIGNKNGTVYTGFMKDWGPVVPEKCAKYGVNLTRSLCGIQYALLLNKDIDSFVHCGSIEKCVYPYDKRFEDAHGQVHNCVGGHMSDLLCASNDPLFLMYHSFIDLVFQNYIDFNYPRNLGVDPLQDYPTNVSKEYWRLDSLMFPFSEFKVADGFSRNFSDNLVEYEERPRRCSKHTDCTKDRSDALWCDVRIGQCMAKVYLGGSCESYPDEACYNACGRNGKVVCDSSSFTCQCRIAKCFSDDDCIEEDWLCDMASSNCKPRMAIGEFCGSLTDKFCNGKCPDLKEALKCVSGKCSCELKSISCNPNDHINLCPKNLYCDSIGLCRPQVPKGESCKNNQMCQSRCHQGYSSICSKTSATCQCVLKPQFLPFGTKRSDRSFQEKNRFLAAKSIMSKRPRERIYCKTEADCVDGSQLCLRERHRSGPYFSMKRCFYVGCWSDADCKRKGFGSTRCYERFCIRGGVHN